MSLLEHDTVIGFDQRSVAQAETPPTARQAYGRYLVVGAACTEAYLQDRSVGPPEINPQFIVAELAWNAARIRDNVPEGKFF